ncbi:transforming growth factor beta regulator 1 [Drosophila busckii]|uniref:transforming growth factor beta regulator 1 n=1 Tax=Drosophila busckii TaxID=30019 RepID=UPI00143319E7|nr:transforming growth factor beta regulator 1 [Drosophila busckii]
MKTGRSDFKTKYNKIKSRVKNYILENSSIVDEVCYLQSELAAAREERLFLIERLMFHEGLDKSANLSASFLNDNHDVGKKSIVETQNSLMTERDNKPQEVSTSLKKISLFPLKLNNILIHTLGEIIPSNPNFHNANWIYPVGYVATRIYAHPSDPRKKCVFTCKILNNAGVPQFQLIPDNDLDGVFFGETANICHQELLNRIQSLIKESTKIQLKAKGEIFFGLSNQSVHTILLKDTRVHQCSKFKGFSVEDTSNSIDSNDPTLSFTELQHYLS